MYEPRLREIKVKSDNEHDKFSNDLKQKNFSIWSTRQQRITETRRQLSNKSAIDTERSEDHEAKYLREGEVILVVIKDARWARQWCKVKLTAVEQVLYWKLLYTSGVMLLEQVPTMINYAPEGY